jgi:hypothetical protein
MLTFGDLKRDPSRVKELEGCDVLVSAASAAEVVVQEAKAGGEATMVFMHETINMMKADRADKIDKLKAQLADKSVVVALKKKASSFWDYITLGRATTADIAVDDPAVSNVHAHFMIDDDEGRVSVQDVGSSNGTFINRQPMHPHTPATLASGDCVRFGQSIFYYVSSRMLKELIAK